MTEGNVTEIEKIVERINEVPNDTSLYLWDQKHPRWTDETFVMTTEELIALAAQVKAQAEAIREMRRALVGALGFMESCDIDELFESSEPERERITAVLDKYKHQ